MRPLGLSCASPAKKHLLQKNPLPKNVCQKTPPAKNPLFFGVLRAFLN